jgi:hypothetical protein
LPALHDRAGMSGKGSHRPYGSLPSRLTLCSKFALASADVTAYPRQYDTHNQPVHIAQSPLRLPLQRAGKCLLHHLGSCQLLQQDTKLHRDAAVRITIKPNSSPKGLIGCPSTPPWPGLKFARVSRSSYNLTPLPLRSGDASSRAMSTVTGFPFADPRTHSM